MKRFIIILLIVCPFFLSGQTTFNYFNKTYSLNTAESNIGARNILSIEDNHYMVEQQVTIDGEFHVLRKLDSLGNELWAKNIVENEDIHLIDTGSQFIETKDGNFVVTYPRENPEPNVSNETQLIKLDKEGNVIWKKSYASLKSQYPKAIIETEDGGFLITGDEAYPLCMWLMKVNSAGEILWQKTYCKDEFETRGRSIISTPDGGYLLGGFIYWGGENYTVDSYIVKVDSFGNLEWEETFGQFNIFDGYAEFYHFDESSFLVVSNRGEYIDRKLIIKLMTYEGETIWEKEHKPFWNTGFIRTPVIVNDDGSFIGGGHYQDDSSMSPQPSIYYFDSEGEMLWNKKLVLNLDKSTYFWDIDKTEDGGYVFCGFQFTVPQISWVVKTDSLGNTCSFVGCDSTVTVIDTTNVSFKPLERETTKIYPNPTKDIFYIENTLNNQSLEIYTLEGKLVFSQTLSQGVNRLDVKALSEGMYYCRLKGENEVTKLVITK